MRIPEWAPSALTYFWNNQKNYTEMPPAVSSIFHPRNEPDADQHEYQRSMHFALVLLRKLISDPSMEFVWMKLDQVGMHSDRHWAYDAILWSELLQCKDAWEDEPKKTVMEKRKHLDEMHARILDLVNDLGESGYFYGTDVDMLMKDSEIETAGRDLNVWREGTHPDEIKDNLDRVARTVLSYVPPVRLLLLRLAQFVQLEREFAPLVKQPRDSNAQIHFYVRWMSAFFQREYRQPLHNIVAIVVNLALDRSDLDANQVKQLAKHVVDRRSADYEAVRQQFIEQDEE